MITSCRSCGSKDFIEVLSLGDLYLSDFVEKNLSEKPAKFPLDLLLCSSCTLLQLRETTSGEYLYTDRYGYRSGINTTMRQELTGLAQSVESIVPLQDGDVVIDIGCNDGTLLQSYKAPSIRRVGFDPVKKFARFFDDTSVSFISDYFGIDAFRKHFPDTKAKIITAIAMFYDLDDPNKFVSELAACLDTDGVCVLQQNYLLGMLEQNAYDNIVHEHLEYYSLRSLEFLLTRHDLEVFDVLENDINGGSFRTYIKHKNNTRVVTKRVAAMRKKEKIAKLDEVGTYLAFAERVQKNRDILRAFIEKEVAEGKRFYVYGASTRGNTLLQYCGLNTNLISAAVERNPEKWGKKIASVDIPIISEEQARKDRPDYMLVLPWFFKAEFLERERAYLESGGHFIFPLPEFEII
jgi:SAM-dependent methyltransferase